MSRCGEETQPTLWKSDAKRCLASALLEQIKISCYTEYKSFGPFTNLQYVNVESDFRLSH